MEVGSRTTGCVAACGHAPAPCLDFKLVHGGTRSAGYRQRKHEVITERTIAENELAFLYMPGTRGTMGQLMDCFPSTLFSTTFCATLSLPSEMTVPTSGAQQGIYS
jgi:hypothetical protein